MHLSHELNDKKMKQFPQIVCMTQEEALFLKQVIDTNISHGNLSTSDMNLSVTIPANLKRRY